jgi:hypothetical protein
VYRGEKTNVKVEEQTVPEIQRGIGKRKNPLEIHD